MGTYYDLYCEAKIGGEWHNIDFHMSLFGHDQIVPIISGQSMIRSALEFENLCYPFLGYDQLSPELKQIIPKTESDWRIECIQYMEDLSNRDLEKPEICGFFRKQAVYDFEAGTLEALDTSLDGDMVSNSWYHSLSEEERKAYIYYEYTEPFGHRDVLRRIKRGVEARIDAYNELIWSLPDEQRVPIGPSDVRVIVHMS